MRKGTQGAKVEGAHSIHQIKAMQTSLDSKLFH